MGYQYEYMDKFNKVWHQNPVSSAELTEVKNHIRVHKQYDQLGTDDDTLFIAYNGPSQPIIFQPVGSSLAK